MKYSPFDKSNKKQPASDSGDEIVGIELLSDPNVFEYYLLKNDYLRTFDTPKDSFVYPTENDYTEGIFKRHFLKKRNDDSVKIIEVDKDQFSKLSLTDGIDANIYFGIIVEWKITGFLNDTYDSGGTLLEYGIKNTNERTLILKEKEMQGISDRLRNLQEFAKPKTTTLIL